MNDAVSIRFAKTEKALQKLHAVLQRPAHDDVMIDATIQRFEFSLELLWKLMRSILAVEGIVDIEYPKKILIKAYSVGLIENEKLWLAMLDDRNETSHTYDEKKAHEIYDRIKNYYGVMQSTFDALQRKYA